MHANLDLLLYMTDPRVSDGKLLTGILDIAMHAKLIDAYVAHLVPQLGESQGQSVYYSRSRRTVPSTLLTEAMKSVQAFDITEPGALLTTPKSSEGLHVESLAIARHYNINLGCVIFVSRQPLSRSRLQFVLALFEELMASRKKLTGFSLQGNFLKLDVASRELLDKNIGDIVHRSVNPHETIVFNQSSSGYAVDVSYSSCGNHFSVPKNRGPWRRCFEELQPVKVGSLRQSADLGFPNMQFLHANCYESYIMVPVGENGFCHCVVACFFRRKNAVSSVEEQILETAAKLLADYYRSWSAQSKIRTDLAEVEKMFSFVKQSLLIADIMHDATEDLVAARLNLGVLRPKGEIEREALDTAKDSLKSLIKAAKHFRTFFSKKAQPETARELARIIEVDEQFEHVSPWKIVNDLEKKYILQLQGAKINLKNHCQRDLTFRGIRYNVRRAIDNALRNSMYQLSGKSHVSRKIIVTATRRKDSTDHAVPFVEISIYDNGFGVEPEEVERIRQPFVSKRKGMGLGMSIMDAACEAQGGRMFVENEWGRSFRVVLQFPEK